MSRIPTCLAAAALAVTLFACSAREAAPDGKTTAEAIAGVDDEVKAFQLRLLAARLQTIPAGVLHDYVAGILATRSGRAEDAIDLLTHVLPELRHSQPERAAHALEALADAYMMVYRYREAADAYDEVKDHFAGRLQNDVTDDAALARILAHAPPQTVAWNGLLRLPTSKNAIGSLVSTLEANGVHEEWLLDTGANQSVVSRSFAARLGLATLAGSASTGSGITGRKSTLQAAILPDLQLGGATIRSTAVIVLDDQNLRVGSPTQPYQIHAILGFPALKALGSISFTHDGLFLAAEPKDAAAGVKMFMRGLTPAIECDVQGEHLLFTFDTGASSTDLSVRYYEQFRRQAGAWRTQTVESGGAGGSVQRTMFIQPSVNLRVGDAVVTLKDVPIFSTRMNAGIDVLFGNLGQDFVADVERFTLDFVNMRFSLGAPLSAPAKAIH
jgi:predicted aspartyl protease